MRIFADAYQGGQFAGQVLRWVVLLALGLLLVRRLIRRSFGSGLRRSLAGTLVGLVVVVAGVAASVAHDFRADDMRPQRATLVAGCQSQGQTARLCGCYADELLRRTDHDRDKFQALADEMVRRHDAGREMPAPVLASVAACRRAEPKSS
jgi:hypothetical protein